MKKLVVLNWVSIDGFIAPDDGGVAWVKQDPEINKASHELINADTMLVGRVTYDSLEAFWPKVAVDPKSPPPMKEMANEVLQQDKVVVSKSLKSVKMQNSRLLQGGLVEGVKALKNGSGSDIMIIGSGTIIPLLADAGLIDEYVLSVTPVVLGSGRPQFENANQLNLTLAESRSFPSDNILLHYKKA